MKREPDTGRRVASGCALPDRPSPLAGPAWGSGVPGPTAVSTA